MRAGQLNRGDTPDSTVKERARSVLRPFSLLRGRRRHVAVAALLSITASVLSLADAMIIAAIVDNIATGGALAAHFALGGMLVMVYLVRTGYDTIESAFSLFLQSLLSVEFRGRFLGSIFKRISADESRRPGELVHVETVSLSRVQAHATDGLTQVTRRLALLGVALVLLLELDLRLAGGLLVLCCLWFCMSVFLFPYLERHASDIHNSVGNSRSLFVDAVQNADLVRLLNHDRRLVRRYLGRMVDESLIAGRFLRFNLFHDHLLALLPTGVFFSAYIYGGWLALEGIVSIGEMIAFNLIAQRTIQPVQGLAGQMLGLPGVRVASDRVFAHLDPQHPLDLAEAGQVPHRPLEAHDVTCRRGGRTVLHPTRCKVHPGELLLVRGDSGAGKTMLAHCLAGLVAPDGGWVSYDGKADTGLLRSAVRLVASQPQFFDDTIAGNLRAASAQPLPDEALWEALRLTRAAEVVEMLPDGLHTSLAQDDNPLSTGQQQRLSAARALLAAPRVLILDEALAAVPAAMERDIIMAIRAAHPDMAMVVVSHRDGLEPVATCTLRVGQPGAAQSGTGSAMAGAAA